MIISSNGLATLPLQNLSNCLGTEYTYTSNFYAGFNLPTNSHLECCILLRVQTPPLSNWTLYVRILI
jgi:hypothetical protein